MKVKDLLEFLNSLPEELKDSTIYLHHHPEEKITETWGRHEREELIFFDKQVLRLVEEWRERRQGSWARSVFSKMTPEDQDKWMKNAKRSGVL